MLNGEILKAFLLMSDRRQEPKHLINTECEDLPRAVRQEKNIGGRRNVKEDKKFLFSDSTENPKSTYKPL